MKKILITSALPYANGPLHFGHIAGAYLPGDCYARFQRMQGNDVLYICGSDEYGVAITLSAEQAHRTPKEHVDIFHTINKNLFQKLLFSFDHYSRTTCSTHAPLVQQFFLDLLENGYIEERITNQLYSEQDHRFLADRYVEGTCPNCAYEKARGDECPSCGHSYEATDLLHPKSKLTGAPLVKKPTKHWFLLLDQFKERLHSWITTKQWKPNVMAFIEGYINQMHARAITRDSDWGVPVPLPNTEGKVLYVWFDAPIGYISATQEWAQQQQKPNLWEKYWLDPNTLLVHFIGKDNIPFHATIFPTMIMGQNQPYHLVDELPANEFFHYEGKKFSKSEGWTIDLDTFFQHYSADQIRYTIAANAPETADAEFTWKDFQMRCNTELLGKLGNFIHRTLVFAQKQCQGTIPPPSTLKPIDTAFQQKQLHLSQEITQAYQHFHLRKATHKIMELAQEGNIYFNEKAPWKDAKDPSLYPHLQTTIHLSLQCIKLLAIASSPIIPHTAQQIWEQLGFSPPPLDQQHTHTLISTPLPPLQQILPLQYPSSVKSKTKKSTPNSQNSVRPESELFFFFLLLLLLGLRPKPRWGAWLPDPCGCCAAFPLPFAFDVRSCYGFFIFFSRKLSLSRKNAIARTCRSRDKPLPSVERLKFFNG